MAKVMWFSQDVRPERSKNILIRLSNSDKISYCGDYSCNPKYEEKPFDWKTFCAYILLTTHIATFEWCYWEDVEVILIEG